MCQGRIMPPAKDYRARQYLYSLKLSTVKERLQQWGWHHAQIRAGIQYYLDYLFLRWKYPDIPCPPSEDIAVVWQAHIIDTVNYKKICQELFGECLEYKSPQNKAAFDDITQKMMYQEFGRYIPQIRYRHWYQKITYYIRLLGFKLFSAITISSLIATGYGIIESHNNYIEHEYKQLLYNIRQVSKIEEEVYVICNEQIQAKYPNFYISTLYKVHLKLRDYNAALANQEQDMRMDHLLPQELINKLRSYVSKIDHYNRKGLKLCSLPLRNPTQTEKHRWQLEHIVENAKQKQLWELW